MEKVTFNGTWKLIKNGSETAFSDGCYNKLTAIILNEFGKVEFGKVYEIEGPYLQCCGPKCTSLWPNSSCGICGGTGSVASL